MSYLRFTKIIIDYFRSTDRFISRRNKMFWHTAQDDTMYTSMKCISKHEKTQVYGTILPKELTDQAMLESKPYQTYYAFASGEKTPKPKYVRKKANFDTSPKQKSVQATKGTRIKTKANVAKSDKKKQHAKKSKAKGLVVLSESKVPNEQQQKTSGADEGTTIPGVLDEPIYDYESDKEVETDTIKRDKIQAKPDKTKHKTKSVEKTTVRSQQKVKADKVKAKEIKQIRKIKKGDQNCHFPNLPVVSSNPSTSNPKCRNRRRSKQHFILEESPIDTMADQRTMEELLRAPTEGYKDLLRACPHHGFTEFYQLNTFYNALNPADQDSLNAAAGGNLLERRTQDVLTIIKNKSKQTSVVTTAMTAILKQFQATPPPASVKAVEETCVTCGGAHPYYQCLVAGFNRGNNFNPEQSYQAPTQQNQNVPLNELEKVKRINEANMKAMQTQINMVKNKLRNEIKKSIQASLSNQTNEIKNIMASLFQMNTASTSGLGSLPSNTISNPKGELKAITTRSGIVLDGPTVPTPPPFINPEEEERVKETLTDPDLSQYTIKVPPPPVQKYKPPSQREYVMHQRDPLHPNIPYPSRMLKQKQQEKDEVQIQNFWQMFKQLHINITLADALILMPKYQKMLKDLLSNKEKLQELANTPLNENCSVVISAKP
nr:reverse transcriptase domain-containing protein [Tanacetum cinerariifolium]